MDLDTLAAELHAAYEADYRRYFPGACPAYPFAELPQVTQSNYRAAARRALELLAHARTVTLEAK